MKKLSQPTIQLKQQELQRIINDTITELNTKMQQATEQLNTQIQRELTGIVNNLNKEVEQKLNELRGQTITVSPQQMTQLQTADDGKPAFWRRNLDYGEKK